MKYFAQSLFILKFSPQHSSNSADSLRLFDPISISVSPRYCHTVLLKFCCRYRRLQDISSLSHRSLIAACLSHNGNIVNAVHDGKHGAQASFPRLLCNRLSLSRTRCHDDGPGSKIGGHSDVLCSHCNNTSPSPYRNDPVSLCTYLAHPRFQSEAMKIFTQTTSLSRLSLSTYHATCKFSLERWIFF